MKSEQPLIGQVALVTGAARGQGRAHAVGLAEDGADVVICDVAHDVDSVLYPLGTNDDLQATAELVRATGRSCLALTCDIRRSADVDNLVSAAAEHFGRLDIAVANAGVTSFGRIENLSDETWNAVVETNLTGTFHTLRAVLPHMQSRGYGRIIATSSMAARGGSANAGHYSASKWGVIGLVKSLALEVADQGITANVVCTGVVNTKMIHNASSYKLFRPDLDDPSEDDVMEAFRSSHVIPVPWVSPEDVALVVRYLALPSSRYVTGSTLDVSAGLTAHMP